MDMFRKILGGLIVGIGMLLCAGNTLYGCAHEPESRNLTDWVILAVTFLGGGGLVAIGAALGGFWRS